MTRQFVFIFTILLHSSLAAVGAYAGDTISTKDHTLSFEIQMIQIKDEFNYGLVYNGIQLNTAYSFKKIEGRKELDYSNKLGFGATFNKGAGLAWRFIPIDIFYGYRMKSSPITLGAYFAADYNWQQYAELQGGKLFWFTSLEIGAEVSFNIPIKKRTIELSVSNSIAGFNSRPAPSTETYFYSFDFKEFFSAAHRDLTFGSFNQFNHTQLNVELVRKHDKRFSIAYRFEYFGYYKDPNLNYMNHTLGLNWKIGKL